MSILTILLTATTYTIDWALIGTGIGTFFTAIAANEWVLPHIKEWWTNRKEQKIEDEKHKINIGKEIFDTKEAANKTYQQQLDFQLNHIEKLQNIIDRYQSELKEVYSEVEELRGAVAELKKIVMENKITISQLQLNCCSVENCKLRVGCLDI